MANSDKVSSETTAEVPKSTFDKLLGSLPVILTVLSTLLAGLSSSEMTQAQYYRSLAAQFQSKVGDQWNFFQAKRQRGAIVSGQGEGLRAQAVTHAETDALSSASRLARELDRVTRCCDGLLAALATGSETPQHPAVQAAAATLRRIAATEADQVATTFAGRLALTAPPHLTPDQLDELFQDPRPALMRELANHRAELVSVLEAVDARRAETEIAAPLRALKAEELQHALDLMEARAAEQDEATRSMVRSHEQADVLAAEQANRLRPLHAATRDLELALAELAFLPQSPPRSLREAGETAAHAGRRTAEAMVELVRNVQLARCRYNEKRYECEARYNQVIAGLYEAQVRKSSLTSDRHRFRSYLFFYAMLGAQGGVTVASFALALRQHNSLWSLAGAAGLLAMAAGIYVYLFI